MVGDEMMLSIDEGNHVMDARKKGTQTLFPHFMSRRLVFINLWGISDDRHDVG
jgi:hypothetical protein